MKHFVASIVLACLTVACGYTKGSNWVAPGGIGSGDTYQASPIQALSLVIGTWTGVETASVGESGSLIVTFTQSPAPDGVVAATISWKSALTSLTYHGTLSGTIGNMVITVSDYLADDSHCGYVGNGALNAAGTQITGTYHGTGPAPCPTKAGSFVLNGRSYVQPQCPTAFTYSGPNPFELPNSSTATELAYVKANVHNSLVSVGTTTPSGESTSWTSTGNYAVVIVKAAQKWYIYLNVQVGNVLLSQSFNQNGGRQAVSHVHRFNCISATN